MWVRIFELRQNDEAIQDSGYAIRPDARHHHTTNTHQHGHMIIRPVLLSLSLSHDSRVLEHVANKRPRIDGASKVHVRLVRKGAQACAGEGVMARDRNDVFDRGVGGEARITEETVEGVVRPGAGEHRS